MHLKSIVLVRINLNSLKVFPKGILCVQQWAEGYSLYFGIVYVDKSDGYKRYPKDSAYFLAKLFGTG